jgi:LysM repeat protein
MLMHKKLISILAIFVTMAVFLAACQRSASTGPLPTPTATGNLPVDDPMKMLKAYATQTAALKGGVPLNTPLPDVTGTPTVAGTLPSPTPTSLLPATGVPGVTNTPIVAQPAITVTPPARPATYTLHDGEFPYCIARRFNVNPEALMTLNGLTAGQTFSAGLALNIPQTGSFPGNRALKPHPATYNVLSGETIYSIACKFGDVDPLAIAAVNSLAAPYTLTAGRSLNIP